jgi:hypothetical protein
MRETMPGRVDGARQKQASGDRGMQVPRLPARIGVVMATPTCTMCDQEVGVLITTMLADGETVVVGGQCLPGYALEMAAAMSQGMPPELGEALGGAFDRIAANDPRPAKPATRKARGKPEPAGPPAAPDSERVVPEAVSVAPDGAAGDVLPTAGE